MSNNNGHFQHNNRGWTQPNPTFPPFTGMPSNDHLNGQAQVGHEPRITEDDMQEDPEQYESPGSNAGYVHTGYSPADQPWRSVSVPNAGQLMPQYGSTQTSFDTTQFHAMVATQVAQVLAQSQGYANPHAGSAINQDAGPPRPTRQGHEYNGKLLIGGGARVLMGDLTDGRRSFDETTVHKYNFVTSFARNNNAELVVGNSTSAAWHRPNQGQPTYANGVYTNYTATAPQGMPPHNPYQQNMYPGT